MRASDIALAATLILFLGGCHRTTAAVNDGAEGYLPNLIFVQNSAQNPLHRESIWEDFDGNEALAEANSIADYGPRPSGSEANIQLRTHLIERLKRFGWAATEQRFTEHSPEGKAIQFCNLVARFSGSQLPGKRVLIGAHFDTIPTREFRAVGATDGAANTAILVELARVLSSETILAGQVELLFLDGDAPFKELNLSDGLFGSRFYVQMLRIRDHPEDVRAAVLLRNTGTGALNYAPNGDQTLIDRLKAASLKTGFILEPANRLLLADQMPFLQAGIPSVALLEANSIVLHTADDTADRLSADALAKTGKALLYFIATTATTQ